MFSWNWSIRRWRLLVHKWGIDAQDIWWFLSIHFGIWVFLLLNIWTSRCCAFPLSMLNNRLLLLLIIRLLLLILIRPRLVRVKALELSLRRLLSWFVGTETVLSVQLSIDSLASISAGCVSNDFSLLWEHLYLLVFLLSFSALRPPIISIRYVILCHINLARLLVLLGHHFRGSHLIHRFHPLTTVDLRVWLLFAVDLIIHSLHESIVSVDSALDIRLLCGSPFLTQPRLHLLLLLNQRGLFEWGSGSCVLID